MPASYIGGKVPKFIVRDVFGNILRYSSSKKTTTAGGIWTCILLHGRWVALPLEYRNIYEILNKKGKTMSVDNLPDKSRNISSYIMECGSLEKFEFLLKSVNFYYGEHFSEIFVVISSWNSSEISEGEEIFLQLLQQCTLGGGGVMSTALRGQNTLPGEEHILFAYHWLYPNLKLTKGPVLWSDHVFPLLHITGPILSKSGGNDQAWEFTGEEGGQAAYSHSELEYWVQGWYEAEDTSSFLSTVLIIT
jgi:hypothetical protein